MAFHPPHRLRPSRHRPADRAGAADGAFVISNHPITGDPVIIAPERAGRPNIFRQGIDRCPFCPGSESDTPPEIWRDRNPWRIRIFPNKYPATEQHEVIVEAADHNATFDNLTAEHATAVVASYISRYRSLTRTAESVCIFKNHGFLAGASIPHSHSQVIATPFVPPRIVREGAAFASQCPLCAIDDEPLIAATENYRWIAPRGSMMAYEQWIVPNRHAPEIVEGFELGPLLQRSARAIRQSASQGACRRRSRRCGRSKRRRRRSVPARRSTPRRRRTAVQTKVPAREPPAARGR